MTAYLESSAMTTGLENVSFHSNSKKAMPKNVALNLHASKVMFEILQVRIQQYVNHELPDEEAWFRTGRRTRAEIANIRWIIEKAREFQKNIYICFIDYAKAFDHVNGTKLWKILKEMGIPDHLTCPQQICIQVKKQWLEPVMEQKTGSKLGNEYDNAIYCHSVYLASMQCTSCEMPGWMKLKLELRFLG